MTHIVDISIGFAVNYSICSLDGKYMAAVGDDSFVLLFDVQQNYKKIAKLKEFKDGGFSCSFSVDSTLLAAASQDGSVAVWDLRMRKILAKLLAKQVRYLKILIF